MKNLWILASICCIVVATLYKIFNFYINVSYPLNLSAEENYKNSSFLIALNSYPIHLHSAELNHDHIEDASVVNIDFEDLSTLIALTQNNYRIDLTVLTPNTQKYQELDIKSSSLTQFHNDNTGQNSFHNSILLTLPTAGGTKFVFNIVAATDLPDEDAFKFGVNKLRQIIRVFAKHFKSLQGDVECDINIIVNHRIGINQYLQTVFVQDVGNIQYLTTRKAVEYAQSSSSSPFYYSHLDLCNDCTVYTMILYWGPTHAQIVDTSIKEYSKTNSLAGALQYLRLPNLDGSIVFIDSSSPISKRALFDVVVTHLRGFMDIPQSNKLEYRTAVVNQSDKVCRGSNYEDMFITAGEAQQFQLRRLQSLHWRSVAMLGEISRSIGAHDGNPLLLWWLLRSDYTDLLRNILRSLREIDHLLLQEKEHCAKHFHVFQADSALPAYYIHNQSVSPHMRTALGNLSAEVLCRIHDPVRLVEQLKATVPAIYKGVRRLYLDSEGPASRVELPLQEIFALFGPFWIPLTIPAFRMYKFYRGVR